MEEKLKVVFAGVEEKNVLVNENDDEIKESEIQAERPDICLCQKSKFRRKFIAPLVPWLTKLGIIGWLARKALGKNRKTNIVIQHSECRLSSRSPIDSPSLSEHEAAKDTSEDNLEPHSPEKDQSASYPIVIEPMDSIEGTEAEPKRTGIDSTTIPIIGTERTPGNLENSMLIESIEKEKSQKIPVIDQVVEAGPDDNKELITWKEDLHTVVKGLDEKQVSTIDYEMLSPSLEKKLELPVGENDSHDDLKNVPIPVTTEMDRSSKPKRAHKCPKACPCKFSQELIEIFHNAKKLAKDAEKMSKRANHCKFRMTRSEIDFFKKDMKMCNVMIAETRSRRAEMRELMDMWQEANEKMAIRKKEMKIILDSVENNSLLLSSDIFDEISSERFQKIINITSKRDLNFSQIESATKDTSAAENLLTDWLPEGRMEQLRKVQRASEKEEEERLEMLEDNERTIAKEKIEEILRKRQKWLDDEKIREEKRKSQRTRGLSNLKNATELMQKYIDERKSQLKR